MQIGDTEVFSSDPLSVCDLPVDMSEVVRQLCRCRLFDRADTSGVGKAFRPPEPAERRMDRTSKLGHPAQDLISFPRSNIWQ